MLGVSEDIILAATRRERTKLPREAGQDGAVQFNPRCPSLQTHYNSFYKFQSGGRRPGWGRGVWKRKH